MGHNHGLPWCLTIDSRHWGECVCGLDDAFGLFELPSYAFRTQESGLVDVAFNLNRSIVGIHAADGERFTIRYESLQFPLFDSRRLIADRRRFQ